jgi:hypothetical protein
MHGFHMLVMLVVGNAVRDTQCGFKVSPTWRLQGCPESRHSKLTFSHGWR